MPKLNLLQFEGKKVVDATKKLHILVTKKDVQEGEKKDPLGCAAALALLRQTGCTRARVHVSRTYLLISGKWVRYNTSQALRSEIIAFDRGGTFSPGSYILSPLQPTVRDRSTRAEKDKARKARKGKKVPARGKRPPYHIIEGIRPHVGQLD